MLQPTVFQKGFMSTITTKGQVTIPIEIRKYLELDKNDKITFMIENTGEVKLSLAQYSEVKSLRGLAGSLKKPLPFAEMKKIAYEDRLKLKHEK